MGEGMKKVSVEITAYIDKIETPMCTDHHVDHMQLIH